MNQIAFGGKDDDSRNIPAQIGITLPSPQFVTWTMFGDIFGCHWLRSECFPVQPVTCCDLLVFLQ